MCSKFYLYIFLLSVDWYFAMIIPNQCLFLGLQTNHRPIWWSAKDCNPLLAEIEQAIHAPFAAPEQPLGFSQEWAANLRKDSRKYGRKTGLLQPINLDKLSWPHHEFKSSLFFGFVNSLYNNDPDQWIIATGRGIGLVYLLLYTFLCFVSKILGALKNRGF